MERTVIEIMNESPYNEMQVYIEYTECKKTKKDFYSRSRHCELVSDWGFTKVKEINTNSFGILVLKV